MDMKHLWVIYIGYVPKRLLRVWLIPFFNVIIKLLSIGRIRLYCYISKTNPPAALWMYVHAHCCLCGTNLKGTFFVLCSEKSLTVKEDVIINVEPMCFAAVVQVHWAATSAQRTPAGVGGGAGGAAAQRADREHAGGQAAPWRSHPEAHAEQ